MRYKNSIPRDMAIPISSKLQVSHHDNLEYLGNSTNSFSKIAK